MRLLERFIILLFVVTGISFFFIGRCTFNMEQQTEVTGLRSASSFREDSQQKEVRKLLQEINELKKQLTERHNTVHGRRYPLSKAGSGDGSLEQSCVGSVEKQVASAELEAGTQLNNEYEVLPFSHFTLSRMYPAELGLGKRVAEKPIGYRRKDIFEIIGRAVDMLNSKMLPGKDGKKLSYSSSDLVEGIHRVDPTTGSQYELYFRIPAGGSNVTKGTIHSFHKIMLMRPFAPVQVVSHNVVQPGKEMVNIVLPLSGRIETFRSFMEKFSRLHTKHDKRLFLTVVYFGEPGLNEVRSLMSQTSKDTRFKNMKLLTVNESFSRGRGLQVGAEHWTRGDAILFLCDVDVVFSAKFLERCRRNADPGKKVYYPVVFSLYNPEVVYTMQGKKVPSQLDQLIISKDTGFWRDFGFGMTCQYRSDFLSIKGFDDNIVGWGMEDVLLYRKYVRSDKVKVVRATDPGIFHVWHSKLCEPKLNPEQYRACLRSKALNEASHAQMGFLAFKDELTKHQQVHRESLNKKLAGG